MLTLFSAYWWLMFPIFGMSMGVFGMWMGYKRSQAHLDLLKKYAELGQQPPKELLEHFSRNAATDDGDYRYGRRRGALGSALTMLALSIAFAVSAFLMGPAFGGGGWIRYSFLFPALILGALGVSRLILAFVDRSDRK